MTNNVGLKGDENGTDSAESWRIEAQAQLERITGHLAAKKRRTVVALVECRLNGVGLDRAFSGRADTCSRNVWHVKWKHDPIIADVFARVEEMALAWQADRATRALESAAEMLSMAAPNSAAALIALLKAEEPRERRQAAVAILDRAGVLTASKTTVDFSRLSDDELEAMAAGKSARPLPAG